MVTALSPTPPAASKSPPRVQYCSLSRTFIVVHLVLLPLLAAYIALTTQICPAALSLDDYAMTIEFDSSKPLQQTLAIIKPDAFPRRAEIETAIKEHGFHILAKKEVQLTMSQVEEFYAEHRERSFFPDLAAFMTSGPAEVLVLFGTDAIKEWRSFIGPTNTATAREQAPQSIRARFGSDNTRNAVHGSDSPVSAIREIKFYFPALRTLHPAVPDTAAASTYLSERLNSVLVKALTELCKEKPEDPVRALAKLLRECHPTRPEV